MAKKKPSAYPPSEQALRHPVFSDTVMMEIGRLVLDLASAHPEWAETGVPCSPGINMAGDNLYALVKPRIPQANIRQIMTSLRALGLRRARRHDMRLLHEKQIRAYIAKAKEQHPEMFEGKLSVRAKNSGIQALLQKFGCPFSHKTIENVLRADGYEMVTLDDSNNTKREEYRSEYHGRIKAYIETLSPQEMAKGLDMGLARKYIGGRKGDKLYQTIKQLGYKTNFDIQNERAEAQVRFIRDHFDIGVIRSAKPSNLQQMCAALGCDITIAEADTRRLLILQRVDDPAAQDELSDETLARLETLLRDNPSWKRWGVPLYSEDGLITLLFKRRRGHSAINPNLLQSLLAAIKARGLQVYAGQNKMILRPQDLDRAASLTPPEFISDGVGIEYAHAHYRKIFPKLKLEQARVLCRHLGVKVDHVSGGAWGRKYGADLRNAIHAIIQKNHTWLKNGHIPVECTGGLCSQLEKAGVVRTALAVRLALVNMGYVMHMVDKDDIHELIALIIKVLKANPSLLQDRVRAKVITRVTAYKKEHKLDISDNNVIGILVHLGVIDPLEPAASHVAGLSNVKLPMM